MNEAPKGGLVRMCSDVRAVDSDSGDMRTLVGEPIVYDTWTVIRGWEGHFRERIDSGAVVRTLEERGDKVKVLFNHGFDPNIGNKPLGVPEFDNRSDALHVEVPLVDTSYNRDLQALLAAGALDGMSFRFDVIEEAWTGLDEDVPDRTILELRLHEVGPVTFPAYDATTVGVRSSAEFEEFQRRVEYLSSDGSLPAPVSGGDGGSVLYRSERGEVSRMLRVIGLIERGVR